MRKTLGTGISLILTAFVFLALAACPAPEDTFYEYLSDFAQLDRITIAGEIADMGFPGEKWTGGAAGTVYLNNNQTAATGNVVTVWKRDKAAVARLAVTNDGITQPVFSDSLIIQNDTGAALGTVGFGSFVWVEVTSPNKDLVYIYKVEIKPKEPKLASLSVNGKGAALGTPAASWNNPSLVSGSVTLYSSLYNTPNQMGRIILDAAAEFEGMTLAFDVRADNFDPDFSNKVEYIIVKPAWIWVECVSEDGSKLVYRIAVEISNNDTEILNPRIVFSSTVSADTAWTNITLSHGGSFAETAFATHRPAAALGFTGNADIAVTISGEVAQGAVVHYGVSAAIDVEPASWGTNPTLTGLNSGSFIGIRVTAQNGDIRHHKIRVALGQSTVAVTAINFAGKATTEANYVEYGTDNSGNPVFTNMPFRHINLSSSELEALAGADPFTVPFTAPLNANSNLATVEFGRGANWTTAPASWVAAGEAGNLFTNISQIENGAYTAVRLTSEDKTVTATHHIYAYTQRPVLTGLTVSGVNVTNLGTPNHVSWNAITDGAVTISFANAGAGLRVMPVSIPGVTYRLAVTTADGPEPAASGTFGWRAAFAGTPVQPAAVTIADGQYLWIEANAGTLRNMYRIKVTVIPSTENYAITSFSIGGVADGEGNVTGATPVTLAAPSISPANAERASVTLPANQVRAFRFNATADAGAAVAWQKAEFGGVPDTGGTWNTAMTGSPLTTFFRSETLYLRITVGTYIRYYAIDIDCPIVMDSLQIGGVSVSLEQAGIPAAQWDSPFLVGGLIERAGPINSATVTATGNGTISWGVTNSIRVAPAFGTGTITMNDGDFLYIRVLQAGMSAIYRIKLVVGP